MYFFLHKSWIWRTLRQVVKKNSYCHFHNALKECFWSKFFLNFMPRFKSAILAIFQFCQNGTFDPVHDIRNFFLPKTFFWSIMKMAIRKFFHNLSQGPPNPGFMQEKVQKGDFLKKPSWDSNFFCCFRFLWISWRPGTLNWERVVFLPSKNLYRKCVLRLEVSTFTWQPYWIHTKISIQAVKNWIQVNLSKT